MNISEIPAGAVVVGVDGSHHSDHAIEWAARHAQDENKHLVLLYAVGNPATTVAWMTSGGINPATYLAEADVAGQAILDTAAARLTPTRPEGTVHTVVVRSDAREALLEASEHASLVVIGSRGRGPISSLLLGSVGAAVAAHSTCTVVVVRPHHHGEVRRGVLVGSDGTPGSPAVLEFAYRQAAELGLPLTVMHTAWDALATVSDAHEIHADDPEYERAALVLAESLAGLSEKYPDVPVTRKIVRGAPAAGLLAVADTMHLVVVGHQRVDPVRRVLFGSVALGVLEHAKTVVAVVPQP